MKIPEAPNGKVGAAAFAGALSVIAIWVVNTFALSPDVQITVEIASALTTVISFLVGYMMPELGPGRA